MELKKLVGKRIKELREAKNLTQELLAEKVNVKPSAISNLERGKNFPAPENLTKIAAALDIKLGDLFTFEHHQESVDLKEDINKIFDEQSDENKKIIYKIIKGFEI